MTVVNPKSISGINSITTGSGSDNLLTIHTSDASSTERVRINSSGDVIVGSGITVSPDGDIFATGVTTSTTFVGALTGNVTGNISGGTVAGSTGTFTGDVDIADKIVHTGDTNTAIRFPAADTITAETAGEERLRINSSGNVGLGQASPSALLHLQDLSADGYELKIAGNSVSFNRTSLSYIDQLNDTGSLVFRMTSSYTEAFRIDSSGRLLIASESATGSSANADDLKIGNTDSGSQRGLTIGSAVAGNIRFADAADDTAGAIIYNHSSNNLQFWAGSSQRATIDSDGLKFGSDTAAANALDDYEEGTFTPTQANVTLTGTIAGHYTKVGDLCYVSCIFQIPTTSNTGDVIIAGLPFNCKNGTDGNFIQGGYVIYSNSNSAYNLLLNNNSNEFILYNLSGNRTTLDGVSNTYLRLAATYKVA